MQRAATTVIGTFLNVDVEVYSTRSLRELGEELEPIASVLYCGKRGSRYMVSFEFKDFSNQHQNADKVIDGLCSVIAGLSPRGRALWEKALKRVFDIGFESAVSSKSGGRMILQTAVSQKSLTKVVGVNGSLAVTCYQNQKQRSRKPAREKGMLPTRKSS